MTGTTLFFVVLGVGVSTANLMKLIEWLDSPRGKAPERRAVHAARRDDRCDDRAAAELALERALIAA